MDLPFSDNSDDLYTIYVTVNRCILIHGQTQLLLVLKSECASTVNVWFKLMRGRISHYYFIKIVLEKPFNRSKCYTL